MRSQTNDAARREVGPRQILSILMRHKGKMFLFFSAVMLLAVAIVLFAPRSYVSSSLLFVRVGRENMGTDPTANPGQAYTIPVRTDRSEEIASIVQMLTCRAITEQVVDQIGVEQILDPSSGGSGSEEGESDWRERFTALIQSAVGSVRGLVHALELDPVSDREKAIVAVQNWVEVFTPKGSTVIQVDCAAENPQLAQAIAKSVVEVFLAEHPSINRHGESHEFFSEQAELLHDQLAETSSKLLAAKNDVGLSTVEAQQRILEEQVSVVETALLANQSLLASTEEKVQELLRSADDESERLVTSEVQGTSHAATDGMRQRLYDLEITEREYLAKYQQNYPYVQAIRQQVEEAQAIVDAQEASRTLRTHELNPIRQQLLLALATEGPQLKALQAKQTALQKQHDDLLARTAELNTQGITIARLQLDVDRLQSSYEMYAQSLEQARVDRALEMDRISNIKVVQPASLVEKPASPHKALVMAIGLIVATVGSVIVGLSAEWWDPTLKSVAEVESELNLPVVLTIARTRNPQVYAA